MTDFFESQPEALNPYLRTKVLTASPAELRMLLLDGALKFLRQGRDGLATKNYEQAYNGISSAQAIVMELIGALRDNVDPQLCGQLRGLYVFMYTRLVSGLTERNIAFVDEVIKLLEFERETWQLVMDQISSGAIPSTAASLQPSDLASVPRPVGAMPIRSAAPDLVGGTISIEG